MTFEETQVTELVAVVPASTMAEEAVPAVASELPDHAKNSPTNEAPPMVPDFHFFERTGLLEAVSDVHTAAVHFCLHPAVPFARKVYFCLLCVLCVFLQCAAMMAILFDADKMDPKQIRATVGADSTAADELDITEPTDMAVFMVLMTALVSGFSVHAEMHSTRVAEVMLRQAYESASTWSEHGTVLVLLMTQKIRHNYMIPTVLASAPILGLENQISSYQIALNALAILFIFDIDNQLFDYVYTTRQKAYLTAVELNLPTQPDVIELQNVMAACISLIVCLVPMSVGIAPDFWSWLDHDSPNRPMLEPWPRTPCLVLAGVCIFAKTWLVLLIDIHAAWRHGISRAGRRLLTIEVAFTILAQGYFMSMMLFIKPLGVILLDPSPPPPPPPPTFPLNPHPAFG